MFKFLKDKLKKAVSKFSKDTEQEAEVVEKPVEPEVLAKKEKPKSPSKKESSKEKKSETKQAAPSKPKKKAETPAKKPKKEPAPVKKEPVEEKVVPKTIEKDDPVAVEKTQPEIVEKIGEKQPEKEVVQAPEEVVGPKDTEVEDIQEQPKKSFFGKLFKRKEKVESEDSPEEKPTSFLKKVTQKVTTIQLSPEKFEELFWELELSLLENNVALPVIEKVKEDLRDELTTGRTARGNLDERILSRLQSSIDEILSVPPIDLESLTQEHSPLIIAGIGVNGSGKTTSLAKLAHRFTEQGKSVVLAACDTFRAAAIQQLEEHATKLNIPIIKQDYGADAAAVAYDAIAHAKAKGKDVVLIDTAGRLHSNSNLMDELQKLIRVAQPHLKIFVGEATTGNDCLEQAIKFDTAVGIDAIILTKSDVDGSGGTAVSASQVTNKPILFFGTGQSYEDLIPFDKQTVLDALFEE